MTRIHLNKPSVGQAFIRQMVPNMGTVVLVLALLFMADFVGAAPWKTAPKTSADYRAFTMPYQGRLTDASGNPINNTDPGLEMTFALYTQEAGGAPVWSEYHAGVPVSDGLFNVYLGSMMPLESALFADDLWMGVKIGTDPEMMPREKLSAVPYAIWSQATGVPVGTVVSWWRPDASTPIPSDEWMIADGSTVTDPASPLQGQALPDLTERFVMGVPPDAVGSTGGTNTLNLSHRHRVDDHNHSIPGHDHGNGTLRANVAVEHDRVYVKRYGSGFSATHANYTGGTHYNTHITDASVDVEGSTASWSGTSGASHPNTNFQLSSTTDNKPQYVGLLFLVRIK
jgi:hypothetical protein